MVSCRQYEELTKVTLFRTPFSDVSLTATELARLASENFLWMHGRADLVEDCQSVVSELVGNVIRHTKCEKFKLVMRANSGSPLFEVWDSLPVAIQIPPPPYRDPNTGEVYLDDWFPPFDGLTGRGLYSLRALSKACGCHVHPTGKSVWFRL